MIRIEALQDLASGELSYVRINVTPEIAAQLPKGVRLNGRGQAYIEFQSNLANGGRNETGARRMRSLFKAVDKLGLPITFDQPAYILNEMNAWRWDMTGSLVHVTRAEVEAQIQA